MRLTNSQNPSGGCGHFFIRIQVVPNHVVVYNYSIMAEFSIWLCIKDIPTITGACDGDHTEKCAGAL